MLEIYEDKLMNPLLDAVNSFSDFESVNDSPDMEWNSEDGGREYDYLN